MAHPYDHGDVEALTVVVLIVLLAALLLDVYGGTELWSVVRGLHP